MADLISAASLSGAPALIAECGGDPGALLAGAGIDQAVVGLYDRFVPFSALSTLLGHCAAELGVPDFALRLAARQDPDILGPVAIAARSAATIGDALRQVTAFAHVYSPAIEARLHIGAREVAYEFGIVLHRVPYRPHVVELALGVTLATFRMLGGDDFRPTGVRCTHQPLADRQTYLDYFGCTVDFGAEANLLVFPSGLMHRLLPTGDALAKDIAIRFMAGRDRRTAFPDAVHELIVRALPAGAADLPGIARLLMMHPRAVQRELAAAGTTFEALVDGARRELTTTMLADRGIALGTIARQLGYSEQSTLTRSCRRWFGMAPLAKRRELTG